MLQTCLTLGNFVEWCRSRYSCHDRCTFVTSLREFFISVDAWEAPASLAASLPVEATSNVSFLPLVRQAFIAWLQYYADAGLANDPPPPDPADAADRTTARHSPPPTKAARELARLWDQPYGVSLDPQPTPRPERPRKAPTAAARSPFDLTPLLAADAKRHLGTLVLSPAAYEDLKRLSTRAHALWTDEWLSHVAAAAAAFATSSYCKASHWFRTQPVHLFDALSLQYRETKATTAVITLILSRELGGSRILSPTEVLLPESYQEQRVIEETRVDCQRS